MPALVSATPACGKRQEMMLSLGSGHPITADGMVHMAEDSVGQLLSSHVPDVSDTSLREMTQCHLSESAPSPSHARECPGNCCTEHWPGVAEQSNNPLSLERSGRTLPWPQHQQQQLLCPTAMAASAAGFLVIAKFDAMICCNGDARGPGAKRPASIPFGGHDADPSS